MRCVVQARFPVDKNNLILQGERSNAATGHAMR
jgi:hypothetical protein